MKFNLPLWIMATLSAAVPLRSAAQGSLTPPGAPAPTMKSLAEIEPRTSIPGGTNGYAITQPGSYFLTGNISVTTGTVITISTNNVTLDLMGFTISSTANPAAGTAILLNGDRRNITILNGQIQGGITYVGGGGDQYTGPGFVNGISYSGALPLNCRVSDLTVYGCDQKGIDVGYDYTSVVNRCTVRTVGSDGIWAGIVSDSTSVLCGGNGIVCESALNCYGTASVSQRGIYANQAENCVGYSVFGNGVQADGSAINCYGTSMSGYGLNAVTASNCRGSSSAGIGLYANSAAGCYGSSFSAQGIYASTVSHSSADSETYIGIFGLVTSYSVGNNNDDFDSDPGIQAVIGVGCTFTGGSLITYKYLMP